MRTTLLPFAVLAACIDARTGKRYASGDEFDPAPTHEQAIALVAAGCLPRAAIDAAEQIENSGGVDVAAVTRAQINNDGLFDKSVEELQDIISQEGIAVDQEGVKAAVIASIREHRANKPAVVAAHDTEMRTEAGERAARAADAAVTSAQVNEAAPSPVIPAADAAVGNTPSAAPTAVMTGDQPPVDAALEARTAGAATDRYADTKPAKATAKAK